MTHLPPDSNTGELTLVSVILPFLNGVEWLREAIESVVNQSYKNWELILIDDGSANEATQLAKTYSSRFPDQIYYADHHNHANLGVTISRNRAISLSRGSLIAFLDSDDRWMPTKLETQLAILGNHPSAAMVCSASVFWYSWNGPGNADFVYQLGCPQEHLFAPAELFNYLYPLSSGNPPCPSGIMLYKSTFYKCGGFEVGFSGENQLYEDQALLNKIYLSEFVFVSGNPDHYYRKRENSLTAEASIPSSYKRIRLFFLRWFAGYLEKQSPQDLLLRSQVEKAIVTSEALEV